MRPNSSQENLHETIPNAIELRHHNKSPNSAKRHQKKKDKEKEKKIYFNCHKNIVFLLKIFELCISFEH